MRYLVLGNTLLGENCLCFCRKLFLYLIWFFIHDTGFVLLDQIYHIGGATIANFDNIPIKDLAEFFMLFSVLFDKL